LSGRIVLPLGDKRPLVAASAVGAPGACVIGAVPQKEDSSGWDGAVLRGDTEPIRIGRRTNVQDGCVLHADPGYPAIVGEGCVIGHKAVVHGCRIDDGCLIGINATVLTGAEIGEGTIVAAGAVVPEGRRFPARSLVAGVPARRMGEVTEEQTRGIARGVQTYVERAAAHREAMQQIDS
jgi:carbonic anhydrase/acetyltransferase-like protein (isoleucine patch superfamily)